MYSYNIGTPYGKCFVFSIYKEEKKYPPKYRYLCTNSVQLYRVVHLGTDLYPFPALSSVLQNM